MDALQWIRVVGYFDPADDLTMAVRIGIADEYWRRERAGQDHSPATLSATVRDALSRKAGA